MKKQYFIIITLFALTSCSIGKQEVFYEEMEIPPKLTLNGNILEIETRNSIRNSALLIYKIKPEVYPENNELHLKGLQALNKSYKTKFEIQLDKLNIGNLDEWTIFWIDPDGRKMQMDK